MTITGECFCGAVKYKIEGKLYEARSCHCSRCRKAFSSQASAYAQVKPTEFTRLSGDELLTSYLGKHGAEQQFCGVCGSTLCGLYDGDVQGVTWGCLNGDPDVELDMHVGSKANWETIAEGIPQYQEWPPK